MTRARQREALRLVDSFGLSNYKLGGKEHRGDIGSATHIVRAVRWGLVGLFPMSMQRRRRPPGTSAHSENLHWEDLK